MSKELLFVLNVFDDGAIPNILLDLAPFFSRDGWDVRFLTLQPIPQGQTAVARALGMGYKIDTLGCASRNVVGAFFKLKKYLKQNRPALIHSHLGRADIFTAWAKPRGIPQITTFHSVRRNYSKFTLWGYLKTDKRVAHRTGVSAESLRSLYDAWELTSPHSVIYNPVDESRLVAQRSSLEVRKSLNLAEGEVFLLNAGRFIEAKGQIYLIRALPAILGQFPQVRLVMAGSGRLEADLRAEADKLGIADKVRWAGFSGCLPDLIGACDLLVFPSVWEGLGLVPIEALLLQKPVVVSSIPAIREFVTDRETGFFCEAENPESIAQAVVFALGHPELARKTAEQGQLNCKALFNTENIAGQYLALYNTLSKG